MSLLLTVLSGLYALWGWFRGNKDREIGRDEQLNADAEETIRTQKAELDAAVDRPSDAGLSDELRSGKF